MNKKFLAMALALVLLIGGVVSGSLAWLTDKTDAVENTFTQSNIDIELNETKPEEYTAKMIPGWTIEKDPYVIVKANSEKCYVFVDIDESANFDEYMTYSVDLGWTQLEVDKDGKDISAELIYYREVDFSATDTEELYILDGNKVTVNTAVNKDMMDALANGTTTKPTLEFTAYAVQYWTAKDTTWASPAAAWAEASN